VGASRPACAASAGEIAEFLHRLARLRPPALGGDPAEHAALLAFGVVLHRNGWRIIYLGADTPLADLVHTVAEKRPDVVILAAVTPERFQESIPDLITLARTAPLRLAGAGATTSIADTVGATILAGDPITEAQRLTPLS
jgi:O-acetyl-ADP-ribose deacetylase (regulator of RNase III)